MHFIIFQFILQFIRVQYLWLSTENINMFLLLHSIAAFTKMCETTIAWFYVCYESPHLPNYLQQSNVRVERDLTFYLDRVKYDFNL